MTTSTLRLAFLVLFLLGCRASADAPSLLGVGSGYAATLTGAAVVTPPSGAPAPLPQFVTGFNQGWFKTAYGSQWTTGFDEVEARRLLKKTRELGGRVFRIWLFEGRNPEGVIWDDTPGKTHDQKRTVPTGLAPEKLANIEKVLEIAEQEDVQIYLTFFDANIYSDGSDKIEKGYRDEWWNLLNDKYGAAQGFLDNVAVPIMRVAAKHRRAVFGLDLMNEINAMVNQHGFEGGWKGARTFVRRWRTAIHQVCDVPITATFGYWDAVLDMTRGHLTDDDVDFWDFHAYTISGGVWDESELKSFLKKTRHKVYLGEFGQIQPHYYDVLQVNVLTKTMRTAQKLGLAGAFAWRLSDVRPGHNGEARFSYEAYGKWRPAAKRFQELSAELSR